MDPKQLVVDTSRDYASELWNDGQKQALRTIGDTIIAPLTPEENAKFCAELPDSLDDLQRRRAELYATTKFSDYPEMVNCVAMQVKIALTQQMQFRISALLYVLSTRAGCLPLFGRLGPVWEIPREEREKVLLSWQTSRLKVLRQGGVGLNGLITIAFYRNCEAAEEAMGYPTLETTDWKNPPGSQQEEVAEEHYPYRFLNEKLPATPSDTPLEHETDVLIIGSGAGGGVVASYLAQRGLRVMVVDKGMYVPLNEMQPSERFGMEQMHDRLGLVPTADGSLYILSGAGFGGGTTINWSATLKPRYFLRNAWATKFGVPYFATNHFTDDLEACIDRMGASADHIQHNRANSLLALGAARGGQPVNAVPQNTGGHTHYCGKCYLGCTCGHKMGGVQTWLKDAAQNGTEFYTHCEVERILMDNGRATGAYAKVNGHRVIISAKKAVVVSSGSIQTPALLLRTPELRVNKQIGQHLHLHPVAFVHGYYDFPINPWEGGMLTTVANAAELVNAQGWGAKVEVVASLPSLYNALAPFKTALEHKRRAMRYRHSFTLLVLVRDRDGGKVTIDSEGNPEVHYEVSSFDQKSMVEGVLRATEIHMNAGAREIATTQNKLRSFVTPEPVPAPATTTNLIRGSYPFDKMPPQGDITHPDFVQWQSEIRKFGFAPLHAMVGSAHQMGSCRMGADPKTSALDPLGRVRGASNLWVADGSALPEAAGVNPMLTIMATSRGIARNLAQELGVEPKTPPPSLRLPAHL